MDAVRAIVGMASIEELAAELGTCPYIWGGWSLDTHNGSVTRVYGDIDYLVLDLYPRFVRLAERLLWEGW